MSTLVTGANGFTGAHVVRTLLRQGKAVRGLVRSSSNLERLHGLDIELVQGDIADRAALRRACRGVDSVIHTAAHVDLGVVDETEMARVNVEGTGIVLETAVEAGVRRIVHCSTIGVFGDTGGAIADEQFQRTQRSFSSVYDRTKYEAQELVDSYAGERLEAVSVLPSGILGPGDPHFGQIVTRLLEGRLWFWAGGDRVTGIVHVEDVAELLVLAAEKGRPGERYIASSGELTTRQMLEILTQATGLRPPRDVPETLVRAAACILEGAGVLFSFNPPLNRERVHYLYDRCVRVKADKARRELGWSPRPPEEIVRSLVP